MPHACPLGLITSFTSIYYYFFNLSSSDVSSVGSGGLWPHYGSADHDGKGQALSPLSEVERAQPSPHPVLSLCTSSQIIAFYNIKTYGIFFCCEL